MHRPTSGSRRVAAPPTHTNPSSAASPRREVAGPNGSSPSVFQTVAHSNMPSSAGSSGSSRGGSQVLPKLGKSLEIECAGANSVGGPIMSPGSSGSGSASGGGGTSSGPASARHHHAQPPPFGSPSSGAPHQASAGIAIASVASPRTMGLHHHHHASPSPSSSPPSHHSSYVSSGASPPEAGRNSSGLPALADPYHPHTYGYSAHGSSTMHGFCMNMDIPMSRRHSNGMSPVPSVLLRSNAGAALGMGMGLSNVGPIGLSESPPTTASGSVASFGRRSRTGSRPSSPATTHRDSTSSNDEILSRSSTFNYALSLASSSGEPDFEVLDEAMSRSSVFRELHRIVRLCAAQPSCDRMVAALEKHSKNIINASNVRLWLVQRDGLVHACRSNPLPLSTGLVGYVRAKREIVNLVHPASDERYAAEIDAFPTQPSGGGVGSGDGRSPTHAQQSNGGGVAAATSQVSPGALLCVPVEADVRPGDGARGDGSSKDVVAVFQAFRDSTCSEGFSSRDCKVLYRLGEFAGNMLRNSRSVDRAHALYHASLQSHKRSAALLDVAKALASETDLEKVVSIIVQQVPELLDSDRCTLFFVDRDKEELIVTKGASKGRAKNLVSWIFGQSNAPELPFPKNCNEIRLSMRNGIAGHVATTGETLNIVDAHTDPRFNSAIDKETGYRTRSMLCVPMVDSDGVIIGVLQAINKNPMFPRFDIQDETLLKTFAAQAALAVRNAQLLAKTLSSLKQSDAMLEVTKALSQELKIEALIQIICSKLQQLLHSERCTVFLIDKQRKELYTSEHMSAGLGPSLPIDREKATLIYFPMDRGIAGSVATTLQPINIPDAYKDARFNKSMDKETGFRTRSILCTPIVNHRGDCVGVLQVINKDLAYGVSFDENDERLLSAFCAQAAVAIENSRLFLQTERALNHALADQRNMKFMLSVTKNLFADMHLTSMIDQMSMQVHHLLKADDCQVYLVDDVSKMFWLAKEDSSAHGAGAGSNAAQAAGVDGAVAGATAAAAAAAASTNPTDPASAWHSSGARKYPFSTGIVGVVASTGQTVRISSAAHMDPRFHPAVDQRKGKVSHSLLCAPILAELPDGSKKIVGVISVRDEKDRGGFEAEEEKLLKVFCAQAAVAIQNARKFANLMDQAEIKTSTSDHSATDYLVEQRGMKLASDAIGSFQYKMEEITLKGAIGTGSYGEVYRAEVGGQIVAIKKLHVRNLKAEQVDAFCKEASLMCQLNHTNIVGFIGAVTEPSNLAIITQYCARGSLADLLLDQSIWMNFRVKVKFALEAAQGMLYLHKSNPVILHRDLKSDNLLVTEDWTIKVADFGLTRFISEKKQMTQVGTPMWMAPEIIMGKTYTERADVYAFGIILWEILTRLEPYEEKEPMQIVVEVVNEGLRPTLPAEYVGSPLVPLMRDCWHTDPEKRPPFEKIVERLRAILDAIPKDDNSPGGVYGTSVPMHAVALANANANVNGGGGGGGGGGATTAMVANTTAATNNGQTSNNPAVAVV